MSKRRNAKVIKDGETKRGTTPCAPRKRTRGGAYAENHQGRAKARHAKAAKRKAARVSA